jgi:hypothetical protein
MPRDREWFMTFLSGDERVWRPGGQSRIRSNSSQPPIAVRFAVRADAPAFLGRHVVVVRVRAQADAAVGVVDQVEGPPFCLAYASDPP